MSPPLRRLLRGLSWLALALVLSPLVLLPLVLQHEPRVMRSDALAIADVERALRLVRAHDPRRALPGIARTLQLSRHEAELLLNHALARWFDARSQLELTPGRLRLATSVALPALRPPLPRWLNVEILLAEDRGLPRLESVHLGRLPMPSWAVRPLLAWAARQHGIDEGAAAALSLHRVRFSATQLTVVYAWGVEATARVLAALMPARDQARVKRYAEQLAELAMSWPAEQPVSLSQLLPPMFELARQRSLAPGGQPAQENRAALLVLGMVAAGADLATLLPERADTLRTRPLQLTLAGRRDFTQHFLVSATLAAESGTPLADMVGLYKELADARYGGSGFSFNDIAANRAGTRFGALAVQDPARLQQRVAGGLVEQDFMPDVADLPEFLPGGEFRRRFGGPGSPAYDRLLAEIDERLDATALFSPWPAPAAASAPASAPRPR